MNEYEKLKEKAALVRKYCLLSTTEAESGHPTSCLSAADIATVLFDRYFTYDIDNPLNLNNDRFVLSKGHAAPLLYSLFGMAGAYPLEEIKTLRKLGSPFQGHPVPAFRYAEAATGSLGQGLSVGAGLALLAQRENLSYKTYVVSGDGELAEGQVWEAANFASYHKLDNLIAILDINRLAQSGETMFGHDIKNYADRFHSFGFEIITIDGHDFAEIDKAFQQAVNNKTGKPFALIAKTMKGKGVSFLENKDGWHGKALKKEELKRALEELGDVNDNLQFNFKKAVDATLPVKDASNEIYHASFDANKEFATREVFGKVIAEAGKKNTKIYALDADVKNSTFTEDFLEAIPERFIECYIAEQNMVSVAAGLSRLGKIPVVATFGAFLTRAADQIRMARVSESNIKFVGSHVGVSIGEDGPSQMALEDIAMFGALPDTVILQPSDAVSTAKLIPAMLVHQGFVYMRTLRPKTPVLYKNDEKFPLQGLKLICRSANDVLTVIASGITVFEALKAAEKLSEEGLAIRVLDCYCIHPIDRNMLLEYLQSTQNPIVITVEDHFLHGGMGDFVATALADKKYRVEKMAVSKISQSGTKDQLLKDAGIDASAIAAKVKEVIKIAAVLSHES